MNLDGQVFQQRREESALPIRSLVVMPRMYVNDMELDQVSLYRQLRVLKGLWILHRRGFQKITEALSPWCHPEIYVPRTKLRYVYPRKLGT